MTSNAFWQQGEIQAGRSLARPHDGVTSWTQTLLYPPTVLEVRLRLGFIPQDGHARWQLEALDPQGNELLAMRSCPHFNLSDLHDEMATVGTALYDLLEPILNPDPFP